VTIVTTIRFGKSRSMGRRLCPPGPAKWISTEEALEVNACITYAGRRPATETAIFPRGRVSGSVKPGFASSAAASILRGGRGSGPGLLGGRR
jgi:hypothetical protein